MLLIISIERKKIVLPYFSIGKDPNKMPWIIFDYLLRNEYKNLIKLNHLIFYNNLINKHLEVGYF